MIGRAHLLREETRSGTTRQTQVVTTRQTPAVARPATASGALAGVAEGRRELDVSVEMDDEYPSRGATGAPGSSHREGVAAGVGRERLTRSRPWL